MFNKKNEAIISEEVLKFFYGFILTFGFKGKILYFPLPKEE
jgi:hypothetical protein